MAETMPIGTDIDMLCEAVTWAAERVVLSQRSLQRHMRVGFVKAQRLLLLLEDYGITDRPMTRWDSHFVLITEEQLPTVVARLRDVAKQEKADA